MTLVTLKVSVQLKRRMQKFTHINWSEVARHAIEDRLKLEESFEERSFDSESLNRAITIQDDIRAKSSGKWSVSKEIRRWRALRR